MMDLALRDTVVLVTGASAGIGRASAALPASEGARVAGAGSTTSASTSPLPPARRRSWRALILHGRLGAVVNNVGGVTMHDGFLAIGDAAWAAALELNLDGGTRQPCRRSVLRRTRRQPRAPLERGGAAARPGDSRLRGRRRALRAVSKGLAHESGRAACDRTSCPRADANAALGRPGRIRRQLAARFDKPRETAIGDLVTDVRGLATGRLGTPDDVARPIALVMSPLSAQVTGAEWAIDGGALREV
jgi:NAD(P)-dependent dehydrogenase (short-subunit alcohol dehydrogenase family)